MSVCLLHDSESSGCCACKIAVESSCVCGDPGGGAIYLMANYTGFGAVPFLRILDVFGGIF